MRITVYDILGWLAAGMSHGEILEDFPELTEEDIRACLEFAADREHRLIAVVAILRTVFKQPEYHKTRLKEG
jgi:uncharacterized protein (DUF433 family)